MENGFWSRRRWLARLSTSFLIIAVWLAYVAWKGQQTHALHQGQILLCYGGAAVCFAMFIMGVRARHSPPPED